MVMSSSMANRVSNFRGALVPEKMVEHHNIAQSKYTQYRVNTVHGISWFPKADRRTLDPQRHHWVNFIRKVVSTIPTSKPQKPFIETESLQLT